MPRLEHETRRKIVYFGPALSGKATNLEYIKRCLPGAGTELISSVADGDCTLALDYTPPEDILPASPAFELHTISGHIWHSQSIDALFKGAAGVVFVADSEVESSAENEEFLKTLHRVLQATGGKVSEIPLVFQYNKSDSPDALTQQKLDASLNRNNSPSFSACAMEGAGVSETLHAITTAVGRLSVRASDALELLLMPEDPGRGFEDRRSTQRPTQQPAGPGRYSSTPADRVPRNTMPFGGERRTPAVRGPQPVELVDSFNKLEEHLVEKIDGLAARLENRESIDTHELSMDIKRAIWEAYQRLERAQTKTQAGLSNLARRVDGFERVLAGLRQEVRTQVDSYLASYLDEIKDEERPKPLRSGAAREVRRPTSQVPPRLARRSSNPWS